MGASASFFVGRALDRGGRIHPLSVPLAVPPLSQSRSPRRRERGPGREPWRTDGAPRVPRQRQAFYSRGFPSADAGAPPLACHKDVVVVCGLVCRTHVCRFLRPKSCCACMAQIHPGRFLCGGPSLIWPLAFCPPSNQLHRPSASDNCLAFAATMFTTLWMWRQEYQHVSRPRLSPHPLPFYFWISFLDDATS